MNDAFMHDLLASVQDRTAFTKLADYNTLTYNFLKHLKATSPTRIISPNVSNYVFYQYPKEISFRITRPLNANLYLESPDEFREQFEQTIYFLADLKRQKRGIATNPAYQDYLK